MNNKQTLFSGAFSIVLSCIAFAVAILLQPRPLEAAGKYFGGRYSGQFNCSCSGSTLIYIQDYKSNSQLKLIYQAGAAKLYSNNNVFGTYSLGSYSTGGSCMYIVGNSCQEMQSDGMMNSQPGVGTS